MKLVDEIRHEGVILCRYAKPTKNMVVVAGVGVNEDGKIVAGPKLKLKGKLSLKEYAKINEPHL